VEVNRLIQDRLVTLGEDGLSYHSGTLAVELQEWIETHRPVLWRDWCNEITLDSLRTVIGGFRNRARRRHGPMARYERVDGSNTMREIGLCCRPDCRYISRQRRRLAAVHTRFADRIDEYMARMSDDVTPLQAVCTAEELDELYANGS
jgi:hypothetical protein